MMVEFGGSMALERKGAFTAVNPVILLEFVSKLALLSPLAVGDSSNPELRAVTPDFRVSLPARVSETVFVNSGVLGTV
jgi:hypothetical protein